MRWGTSRVPGSPTKEGPLVWRPAGARRTRDLVVGYRRGGPLTAHAISPATGVGLVLGRHGLGRMAARHRRCLSLTVVMPGGAGAVGGGVALDWWPRQKVEGERRWVWLVPVAFRQPPGSRLPRERSSRWEILPRRLVTSWGPCQTVMHASGAPFLGRAATVGSKFLFVFFFRADVTTVVAPPPPPSTLSAAAV